jgi:hypothetical protein
VLTSYTITPKIHTCAGGNSLQRIIKSIASPPPELKLSNATVESAPGVSPRAAHKTGREPLDSARATNLKATAFRPNMRAHPVASWPDSDVADPPPFAPRSLQSLITTTTTGQSVPDRCIGTFGLMGSPLAPFPLQVLKFRMKAKMRVTPSLHRTPHGRQVSFHHAYPGIHYKIPVLMSSG